MNIKTLTLAAVAALALACSFVATAARETPDQLAYDHVGDYTSTPGETEQAFLIRMVPVFRAWANKTGTEACAEIGATADGQTFGLVIGTNRSHLGCVIYSARVLPGMQATGVTIHTHGRGAPFSPNRADMVLMDPATAAAVDTVKAMRRLVLAGQTLDHFSATDFASGPGYLATPTGLLHQSGAAGSEVAVN